jgi:hypothetical protein
VRLHNRHFKRERPAAVFRCVTSAVSGTGPATESADLGRPMQRLPPHAPPSSPTRRTSFRHSPRASLPRCRLMRAVPADRKGTSTREARPSVHRRSRSRCPKFTSTAAARQRRRSRMRRSERNGWIGLPTLTRRLSETARTLLMTWSGQARRVRWSHRAARCRSRTPGLTGPRCVARLGAASYDIEKEGEVVAVLTLVKSAYRLGETVSGVVTFNAPSCTRRVLKVSILARSLTGCLQF